MGFSIDAWWMAGLAAVAAFWNGVRSWLVLLTSVVWVRSQVDYPASSILLQYVHEHYTELGLGAPVYASQREYIRPLRRWGAVAMERSPALRLYRRGLAVLSVATRRDKEGSYASDVAVGHIRGFLSVPRLLIEAHRAYNERHGDKREQNGRYRVVRHLGERSRRYDYPRGSNGATEAARMPQDDWARDVNYVRPLGYRREELGAIRESDPFAGLVFPSHVAGLADRIRRWKESEAFYTRRRIPWRLGVLAYGPPGTGKTSFARAIAQELDLPVHLMYLSTMDNDELTDAWLMAAADAPSMVLLEDLDRVFVGKENRLRDSRLSLDALLNCMSGVEPTDGVLTFVTANDPAQLDPALGTPGADGVSSRPGRLDLAVEFGLMAGPDKLDLARAILGPGVVTLADSILDGPMTPAQVQAACAEIALARLYERGDICD